MSKKDFTRQAVSAFQRTHMSLFGQAHREVDRLERLNNALSVLEPLVLDEEAIRDMDARTRIALMEVITKTQQVSLNNVMNYGKVLRDIKTIVSLNDGVKAITSLQDTPVGDFPEIEYDGFDELEDD